MARMVTLCRMLLVGIVFLSGGLPVSALAQQGSISDVAELTLQPPYPEPLQSVTISLNAYALNLIGATISWFIDGEPRPEFANQLTITHAVGDFGKTTDITVALRLLDGTTYRISEMITPARVDIIMEPQTITGPFYQGGALPAVGTPLRVIALPQEATYRNPAEYSYVWRLNNQVQFLGPVSGKYVAEFTVPRNRTVLEVEALDERGVPVAQKSLVLPVTEPIIRFYVNNPLRGASEYAIDSSYQLFEDEVSIRAVPFHLDRDILKVEHILEWEIGYRPVDNPSADPFEITLRRQQTGGSVPVSFHLRNREHLLQGVEDRISIKF